MHTFTPIPFSDLLRRMRSEAEICQCIFDLPQRNWFLPMQGFDFSARHLSGRASTPVGPAAGPQTQLAQNIVLSWLAGARILELKTVQVNDRLEIPRPSMHIPNVGYNVEWSQELSVSASLAEYAKAVYLIDILKRTRAFGLADFTGCAETVYDISVGYDLEGIRSEKVTGYLRALREPEPVFAPLRRELTGDLWEFAGIELPARISDCVTLSTFHGCPPKEIEAIARYLMEDLGFNVVIKFNPTLLGFDAVRELLIERMGYRHLLLCHEAFDRDLQYGDALEMMRWLRTAAENCGRFIGAKFTNTLVVANDCQMFPARTEPYMYLSGKPLHVLAMHLMQRFRDDAGFEFPISFSAGIDAGNFAPAIACGMVPVTACTDLLRQGGYARLPRYLHRLAEEMIRVGVTGREAFVLHARGHAIEAMRAGLRAFSGGAEVWERNSARLVQASHERSDDLPRMLREISARASLDGEAVMQKILQIAGRMNGWEIVPGLADDPRYHAASNAQPPRQVERTLQLYDCINCDLCISACPNDAMFSYRVRPVGAETELLRFDVRGTLTRASGRGFAMRESRQLAVVADLCNECSNCDVYCPEHGAPYREKERVFANFIDFQSPPLRDGFCRRDHCLHARLGGVDMRFEPDPARGRALLHAAGLRLEFDWETLRLLNASTSCEREMELDTADVWRMKTAWVSIFNSTRPNWTNPDRARRVLSVALPTGGRA